MSSGPPPPLALRLTFSYRGSEVELVDSQTVEKAIPPTDPLESAQQATGFFIELHDRNDALVFRRAVFSPLRDSIEVFAPRGTGSISRRTIDEPSGTFSIVVPAMREAPSLVLRDDATDQGPDKTFRSAELGRFDLTPYLPR